MKKYKSTIYSMFALTNNIYMVLFILTLEFTFGIIDTAQAALYTACVQDREGDEKLKIGGLQKLTLLDYPGRTACTLFLSGCNFRCPFCHNSGLLDGADTPEAMSEDELLAFLEKRKNMLDGICVSGGEPLMDPDIENLLAKIKTIGYDIKIDTNGSYPDRLKDIVRNGLTDSVAMDIKNSREKYSLTAGTGPEMISRIDESVEFLMNGTVDFEFRTTVVKEFHDSSDFEKIGEWIKGPERYFIQTFRESDTVMSEGLHPPDRKDLENYLNTVRRYVPAAELRGD